MFKIPSNPGIVILWFILLSGLEALIFTLKNKFSGASV